MQENNSIRYPAALTWPAKFISYLFHPLFIPTYVFLLLVFQFPYEFAGITVWQLKMRFFSVFWLTAFFPAFAVFLLWRLKFSESIFLRTQKERIVPYVITMFFYWWMYYLSRNFTDQPAVLKFFYMGIFAATVFGLIINNYMKISMHGMGVGGAVAAVILFAFHYQAPMGFSISIAILLTGLVCTSRLLVSDHSEKEVYAGLLVGIICQVAAYFFIM
ncbi:hypothetical protein [Sediminibacterium ginsengisoli]|uniref:PAP2 superfamily protein n=1 Tax=Sediminibacterium ginsengisoli TaxID=413434 RepID=A0A1T4LUD7_9BACT|nr:hypothetical protein [Sediminibacterium ginsengisoli]SJZ58267.1 hypothetical protein SAMN04488132_1033 [Sediminibacterium ginsengisoli]